jgi:hypothetical protein
MEHQKLWIRWRRIRRRLVLGRPGVASLAVVAAAPLVRASVVLIVVVLQVDTEADAKRPLRVGLLRVLRGLGEDEVHSPWLDLVEGAELCRLQVGELLRVIRGLVLQLDDGVLGETERLLRRRRCRLTGLLDAGEGARRDAGLLLDPGAGRAG